MPHVSRRTFVRGVAAGGAVLPFAQLPGGEPATATPAVPKERAAAPETVTLRWLEGTPAAGVGNTWGVPWPQGALVPTESFTLTAGVSGDAAGGADVPVQTWPIAYWPDGTLKWSAHAIPADAPLAETYTLTRGQQSPGKTPPVLVTETRDRVTINTGVIKVAVEKRGTALISSILRGSVEIARNLHLVSLRQRKIEDFRSASEPLTSAITSVTVEQRGPVRAVVRIDGTHKRRGTSWLPFTVRLYLYSGAEHVRMVHTFVLDTNGQDEFIAGLGVRVGVPMRDALYDRHVRLSGDGDGLLREAIRGITGLRRDPGANVRTAQVAGTKLPDPATWDQRVTTRLELIPTWSDYTLSQASSEGFTIKKRTKQGYGWVGADAGQRSRGFGYVGGVTGGLGFGMRDFWQRHPSQLDIRGAATDEAEATVWMWSPEAGPMDTRFYHDGLGQDTYPEQLEGLNITYEDYEPGFGTPYGIARTTELTFWALAATPPAAELAALARTVSTPPQIAAPPAHLAASGAFGGLFAPVDRSTPARATIEDRLDFLFDYYRNQREQRHWYGFWNYGDIMHTPDPDRHVWRYDVGGYAWDNSELSPDLWLWLAYLRSGRADIFRFAEAMTRHTGEVDVYHLGKWAGLGTRHGVLHWADSAKQQRISTAAYRRIYYFLTADERCGDLMRELVDSDQTFLALDPLRKIRTEPYTPDPHALSIGLGTDWSGLAAAWLTEWERRGPKAGIAEKKLLATMRTIARMPNGFVTGSGLYDLDTAEFAVAAKTVSVSHLSAMFGQVEICAELIGLVDVPGFEQAWLQYCRLFNATKAEQAAETGADFGNLILKQGHSRLTAYAAVRLGDAALAARAWKEFTGTDGYTDASPWRTTHLEGPEVLNPVDEASWVDTNTTALYGLAAIQNLALIGDQLSS
ncbi:Tat pathway signal sequence domain protein [Actinoplanes awajinensis subsp. mycoplanecinus]|uniref:Tat pathway signal sequence domain protein n=2 Tax=Actinoplanes awajinensis TaxID=135946 RepID=A0A0X3V6C8_9ACTN|nr:Tat pathway signal sequence domain protein [Actinoplanes awajinensis subsp. mycoplanecinus]